MTTTIAIDVPTFDAFKSIPRLFRDMVVTEKIDGTNAQVHVLEDGTVLAGSRNRYITPDADNFGFASWVKAHEEELREGLGAGRHFGEWWGSGIQRGYGLTNGEKRFSLFNVGRYSATDAANFDYRCVEIPCCYVVPVLDRYTFDTQRIKTVMDRLATEGSVASRGFTKPEGIIVFHAKSGQLFKYTLDKNDGHKGAV
jgi:hypothetical protein